MKRRLHRLGRPYLGAIAAAAAIAALVVALPAGARVEAGGPPPGKGKDAWAAVQGKLAETKNGKRAIIRPRSQRAYSLNRGTLKSLLAAAPRERTRAAKDAPLVLELPAPDGGFQRFALTDSPIMEAGLAAKHPDIKTYAGRGLDDPAATIRADLTPLGFHASVRSPAGAWYIDPYYHLDDSVYISYFGRDLVESPHGVFVEREEGDHDEAAQALAESLEAADVPEGPLVSLKTYRLALVTDPGYSDFFGGPANVTPAKVTLINRVTQVYEEETAIRLVLIDDTDKLNLDTAALATGANGPCGAAACFTTAQVSSCSNLARIRIVVGQIVGASNYDIGHLALGRPGGGVANLGVIGRSQKAQGCTGLAAPVGDYFAVDYVAHEMGHQFAGNHTFNGTQVNCSGGNRNAGASVEPGSGSSIMAYAGICGTDNLQPHSDPYWSQRSYQEITAYVNSNQAAINEVQTISLRDFDVNGDSFRLRFNGVDTAPIVRGTNYTTAAIDAALEAVTGAGTITVAGFGAGTFNDTGFQITFAGALAQQNVSLLELVDVVGASGFVGETDKGGAVDNKGWTITPTGNHAPLVETAAGYTIPVRTPFALTAAATDFDGDTVTYLWEQNDRGAAAGTALTSNTKTNGPLFRQFGRALQMPPYDPTVYNAPGENAVTTDPTRVFPDLLQILANNTNAATGSCPAGNVECFSEFLPTAAYVGFAGVNASPARLNFRVTARDSRPGGGGIGTANTVLTLAPAAGPFLVTSHGSGATLKGNSSQTVTWDVANTNVAPVSTANVKISLSLDGGLTYPAVLAESTPNDGSQAVVLPNTPTPAARLRVEAVGNVFFDLNDASFAIQAVPVVTNDAPAGGATVQYSDALSPTVTISASDPDSAGSSLDAVAVGLPAGLSLAVGATSADAARPGTRTWTVTGTVTAGPGSYPVTVTVTDETGGTGETSFTIVVAKEDATVAYAGDLLAFTSAGGSTASVQLRATVRDADDGAAGDVRNATVTFKEGATTLCGPLPVALLNGDATIGSASCSVSLGLGAHEIDVLVNGFYAGSDAAIVQVSQPDGSFVTGSGWLRVGTSAGAYAATAGSKLSAAFNVKYQKNLKNVQGNANVRFVSGGRSYQIKSTAIESLGLALQASGGGACAGPPSPTCLGLADFRAKANLADVTDPANPVGIAGNLSLEIKVTDRGEPGSADSFAVTLWQGAKLLLSSEWNGSKTIEKSLSGGNVVVH